MLASVYAAWQILFGTCEICRRERDVDELPCTKVQNLTLKVQNLTLLVCCYQQVHNLYVHHCPFVALCIYTSPIL